MFIFLYAGTFQHIPKSSSYIKIIGSRSRSQKQEVWLSCSGSIFRILCVLFAGGLPSTERQSFFLAGFAQIPRGPGRPVEFLTLNPPCLPTRLLGTDNDNDNVEESWILTNVGRQQPDGGQLSEPDGNVTRSLVDIVYQRSVGAVRQQEPYHLQMTLTGRFVTHTHTHTHAQLYQ